MTAPCKTKTSRSFKLPFRAHNPTRTNSASPPLTFSKMKRATPPRSPARRGKRFRSPGTHYWQARFDPTLCSTCLFQLDGRCRTQPQKREPRYLLTFTTAEVRSTKRRKDYLAHQSHSHNLRSAVEATVRSVKHPFPAGKLPVCGQFRVTCMAIASAAVVNLFLPPSYRLPISANLHELVFKIRAD